MAERIGFIGLGNMGCPMSACIAGRGFDLTVYDVDQARTAEHAAKIGAKPAATLAELGAASDIVVTMLPTGAVVRRVLLEQGLADALKPGTVIVDMSSSVPTGSVDLGKILAARGITLIDAPVSGAVPRATTGTLAIMVGADDPDQLERVRPVLSAMGDRIFPTGALGTGHAMKALNNYVAAAGFAAGAEALIMGEKFGLDPSTMLDIMNVSTGRNFSTESTIKQQVVSGAYASGFQLGLITKDVKIAADLADSLEIDLPLVRETSDWWTRACDSLGGEKDHTRAYTVWKR